MPVFSYSSGIGQGSTSSVPLTKRVETVSGFSYLGEAAIGASTASPLWRIKRVSTATGTATILWAGSGNFDQIWANRLTLNYG